MCNVYTYVYIDHQAHIYVHLSQVPKKSHTVYAYRLEAIVSILDKGLVKLSEGWRKSLVHNFSHKHHEAIIGFCLRSRRPIISEVPQGIAWQNIVHLCSLLLCWAKAEGLSWKSPGPGTHEKYLEHIVPQLDLAASQWPTSGSCVSRSSGYILR